MRDAYYVSVDDLAVGIYVHLDMRWVEHNFSLNSFKIKNAAQIADIKALGLKKIRIDPARSIFVPEPYQEPEPAGQTAVPESENSAAPGASGRQISAGDAPQHAVIAERQEFLDQQRIAIEECERQFAQAATSLRNINADMHARPQQARENATELVQGILQTILHDKDVAIHLMNDKAGAEEMYFHALNVSVLAMMLAKELGMPSEDIKQLGIGCLFHDAGKTEIPARILKAQSPTRSEINVLQQHCAYGHAIGVKMGLSQQALDIISQHHECYDGTGYPKLLIGDEISPLARIAAIVNAYDNLCNPPVAAHAMTPYEALSHMYAHERHRFDIGYLSVFVRCMGVYPPGTLVRLSDDSIGLVVAANFGMPLRPKILIFDPSVPKHEATVLNLQEAPELSVRDSLRPGDIGVDVYEYLSPRTHVTYFFETPKRDKSR
ncbi:MAG TPA: HD domain-containing phosphohydrolase [Burkholderiaceae bacterium]|jgi:putative nucleotidyltransferase with HDIG domain